MNANVSFKPSPISSLYLHDYILSILVPTVIESYSPYIYYSTQSMRFEKYVNLNKF